MYEGFLQEVTKNNVLIGWARNPRAPKDKLQICVFIDGIQVAVLMADQYRKDLENSGKGSGKYGFALNLSPWIKDGCDHQIETVYTSNGTSLDRSPYQLTHSGPKIIKKMGNPDLVVVLGMHRSGTSLCMRILSQFGVEIGDDLIDGRIDNPDGFFENAAIVDCQQNLENILEREHFKTDGTRPLPDGWMDNPEIEVIKNNLRKIISDEMSISEGELWGFKDPRSLRFIPLWQQIFEELEISPAYIFCMRNPLAVIKSIQTRNEHPHAQTELLWLMHLKEGLEHLDFNKTHFVQFETWFSKPVSQFRQLAKFLGLDQSQSQEIKASLRKIISKRKNHFEMDAQGKPLHRHTQGLYDFLREPFGGPADELQLRLLLAKVTQDADLFAPWMTSQHSK